MYVAFILAQCPAPVGFTEHEKQTRPLKQCSLYTADRLINFHIWGCKTLGQMLR